LTKIKLGGGQAHILHSTKWIEFMLATSTWRGGLPELATVSESVARALDARTRPVSIRKGTHLFGPDNPTESLLLLISGTIRVQQFSAAGRKIVLYRVTAGEGCILTNACLLAHEDCSAEGIAETDVEAGAILRTAFDELMATSPEFRALVFKSYSERVMDLFFVIEEVAFNRMDIRLAEKLADLRDRNDALHLTHNQLSIELGTARKVVSRQLQEFQRRGWVSLGREIVTLTDVAALKRLAETGRSGFR
jgi:CRP/FNR family transcriptional regulator